MLFYILLLHLHSIHFLTTPPPKMNSPNNSQQTVIATVVTTAIAMTTFTVTRILSLGLTLRLSKFSWARRVGYRYGTLI